MKLISLVTTILLLTAIGIFPAAAQMQTPLKVGVLSFRPHTQTTQNWQPVAKYLSEQLERKVKIYSYSSQELELAIKQSQLDVVITNPAHYIMLKHRNNLSPPLVTQVNTTEQSLLDSFAGVIFTRSDTKTISSLNDLQERVIAVSNIDSLGGYIAQLYEFKSAGLPTPSKYNLLATGISHDSVVDAVLTYKAEAGFIRSGVIEAMVKEGTLDLSQVKIVNKQQLSSYPLLVSTRLYPEWPVSVTSRVDDDLAHHITIALLSQHSHDQALIKEQLYSFSTPKNYDGVEKVLRSLHIAPFDVRPTIRLIDLWHQYAVWIVPIILLSLIIIGAGVKLLIQNKRIKRNEARSLITQQQLEYAVNGAQLGYWDWNYQTGSQYVNDRWLTMLGLTQQDINNHITDWENLIHPDDKQYMINTVQDHIKNGQAYVADFRMKHRDGHWVWIQGSGAVVEYDYKTKEPLRLCGTHQDISERKSSEEQLKLSAQVFEHSQEGIAITDPNQLIVDINPAFTTITGYSKGEVIGKHPSILFPNKTAEHTFEDIILTVHTHGTWQGELWKKKKNGDLFANLLSVSRIQDERGIITNYIAMFTDITANKQHQEKLEFIANYDALTGLPNRNLFVERFHQAIAHSQQTQHQLAVCFLDLDNFKPVNDNFGHEVGDQLLIEVAQRITDNIRAEDTVSRQGGDEFTLLLNDILSYEECEQTMKRIHDSLSDPIIIDNVQHRISASSGITLYPVDDSDIDTLLRHADHAMYQSKQLGRNRYYLFNPMHDREITYKHQIMHDIENAIERNQFELYYQPKVNMLTGEVFGAEALIRWNHPDKGLLPPAEFLPIIVDTELEIRLGDWVISHALKQLLSWQQQGIKLQVSVNIASHHLHSKTFSHDLEKHLSKFPTVDSHSLQLEILESSALGDLKAVRKTLRSCLHDLGVHVALDDFGTGYSSLTHLRSLPVNTIKIDQSFVRDMLEDTNDYAIIDSVIALSDSFGRTVIAEGVETTDHGIMLISMGCYLAQGFAISRPLVVDQFVTWLENYQPNTEWLKAESNKPALTED